MARRIQMKSVCPWYKVESTVIIQGRQGKSHLIADPDGIAETLLTLLNGDYTPAEIIHTMTSRFESTTTADVEEALKEFLQLGLLETASPSSPSWDPYQIERYSRNLGFFELYATVEDSKYAFQERLFDARIAVLGLGGVGSHVALSLVGMGVGHLTILDYDTVELSNLNRQILYSEEDLGRSKVELAAKRLAQFGTRTTITAHEKQIDSAAAVHDVVAAHDLVIAAVDRPKTRIVSWVNQGCVNANVPFLTGGVDRDRAFIYSIIPGVTGCVDCWTRQVEQTDPLAPQLREQMVAWEMSGRRFGEDRAAIYPLVALQAAAITAEVIRFICRLAPSMTAGRMIATGFDDFVPHETERWSRDVTCPTCGGARAERLPETVAWVGQPV